MQRRVYGYTILQKGPTWPSGGDGQRLVPQMQGLVTDAIGGDLRKQGQCTSASRYSAWYLKVFWLATPTVLGWQMAQIRAGTEDDAHSQARIFCLPTLQQTGSGVLPPSVPQQEQMRQVNEACEHGVSGFLCWNNENPRCSLHILFSSISNGNGQLA
jgi:hypothetical protein